jgi:phosphatidylserine/phosphatidylglycerophosphate/cardiolipin synthase-like enzyme
MRNKMTSNGLTVIAIAGTNVISLGLNLSDAARPGCLGFSVYRRDLSNPKDKGGYLDGKKTFEETSQDIVKPGGSVSSHKDPFQTFQWGDYTIEPGHEYLYRVVPFKGEPLHPIYGSPVELRIVSESETGDKHSIYFNRGAAGSQQYANRFHNVPPDKLLGQDQVQAYQWLSRGLLEGFIAFIQRAQGNGYGLFGAIYEFQWPDALKAIKSVADTGADVHIIYDAIPGATGPKDKNEIAIAQYMGGVDCYPRILGKIMHNKFFVLTKNGQAIAVWTGSTNLTENGIYGHANCGHCVDDPKIAAQYLAYWHEIHDCKANKEEIKWMNSNNPNPPMQEPDDLSAVFSPRTGLKVLDWYARIANNLYGNQGPTDTGFEKRPLFMTFAFGMHEYFQKVYEQPDGVLRIAVMEKEGNGKGLAQGKIDIARIRKLKNVLIAVGTVLDSSPFDHWLREMRKIEPRANVLFIHTKILLCDPLGPHPVVVTGSANFSEASTNQNNENMLVIRDNQRVTDIYFGEFLRLYNHYAFREAVQIYLQKNKGAKPESWQPNYLISDDSWQKNYYTPGTDRYLRRIYFSGEG